MQEGEEIKNIYGGSKFLLPSFFPNGATLYLVSIPVYKGEAFYLIDGSKNQILKQMKNLVELKKDELQEIEGGGWLAKLVAEVTYQALCDCIDWSAATQAGLEATDGGYPVPGKFE